MDSFFKGLDCRLRVSGMLADSIMMGIVNSAMEDAYKKSCSKEGILERLNEKSRFCELAIMQLEWCLKFLQDETDNDVVESTLDREKLLSELLETRDRIHNRLEETELAIAEKDRELMERNESLSQLELALEVKDDDISSLHSALKLARVNGERMNGFLPRKKMGSVRRNGGELEFHKLKNAVDEQIQKTRGKIDDGRENVGNLMEKLSNLGCGSVVDNEEVSSDRKLISEVQADSFRLMGQFGTEFEEMASEVGVLKEKLDSSFEMVEGSVSLLKSKLDEQLWAWNVEEEIVNVVVRSFLLEVQQKSNGVCEVAFPPFMLDMNWSDFMDDITSLRKELETLVNQKDAQSNTEGGMELKKHRHLSSRLILEENEKPETNTLLRSKSNNLESYYSGGVSRRAREESSDASSKFGQSGITRDLSKQNPLGHSVAEIIRNHETIIRKKTQEINLLKGELGEKSSNKRDDKNLDSIIEIINRIIARSEDLVKEKDRSIEAYENHVRAYRGNIFFQNDLSRVKLMEGHQASTVIHRESGKNLRCHLTGNEDNEEIDQVEQETRDLDIKASILEDTYAILLKDLLRRLQVESVDYDLETVIREDTYLVTIGEMFKEWNLEREIYNLEKLFMQDIDFMVLTEAVKDIKCCVNSDFMRWKEKEVPFGNNNREDKYGVTFSEMVKEWNNERETCNIERLLTEGIFCHIFSEVVNDIQFGVTTFTEMVKEWNNERETCNIDRFLTEDISCRIFSEVVNDFKNTLNSTLERRQEEDVQYRENLTKGSYNIIFSEMVKEFNNEIEANNIEKLLMEDISCIVFIELVKDIRTTLSQTMVRGQEEVVPFGKDSYQISVISERIDQIHGMDSISKPFTAEGTLELNSNLELIEPHGHCKLVECELEESNEQQIQEGQLLVDKDDVFNLENGKFKKAFQQIVSTNMHMKELVSGVELPPTERDVAHDIVTSTSIMQDGTHSVCLPKKYEESHSNELQIMLVPLAQFSQAASDFEHTACGKIEANVSRLEGLNGQLNSISVQVNSIKKNELLYRKAFTRRCYDLQTAETEVDLLGDQVDRLLSLMEKIYVELDYNSPILQRYFGVMEILGLMRKELHGEVISTST